MWIRLIDGHQDTLPVHMVVVGHLVLGDGWVDDKMDDKLDTGMTDKVTDKSWM